MAAAHGGHAGIPSVSALRAGHGAGFRGLAVRRSESIFMTSLPGPATRVFGATRSIPHGTLQGQPYGGPSRRHPCVRVGLRHLDQMPHETAGGPAAWRKGPEASHDRVAHDGAGPQAAWLAS
jgi:hypothetical protein